MLLIAGGGEAGEPIAARWFQAASPAAVDVWVVPHAGHTQGLATAPRAWESRVISFLRTALADPEARGNLVVGQVDRIEGDSSWMDPADHPRLAMFARVLGD